MGSRSHLSLVASQYACFAGITAYPETMREAKFEAVCSCA